jgi:hypothetical protein
MKIDEMSHEKAVIRTDSKNLGQYLKGSFFRKVRCVFKSPNLQKKIFQKAILNLKFKFPANNNKVLLAGNLNFKLRIVFWNIFFGDLEM